MSETLLGRVSRNDGSAVSQVLEQYGGLVWSLARRYLGDMVEAEDAVQDIFLDVWKSAHRYQPDLASEATFITMIARRRLIDRKRKHARQVTPEPLPEQIAMGDITADRTEVADEAARAREALAELRPEQKRVLELSIDRGLTHEQIAKTTGLPLGTVKTHARRGLIRVRELLAKTHAKSGSSEGGSR